MQLRPSSATALHDAAAAEHGRAALERAVSGRPSIDPSAQPGQHARKRQVRLAADTDRRLAALAGGQHRSASAVIRDALNDYLSRHQVGSALALRLLVHTGHRLSLAQAGADASLLAIVSAAIDEVTDAHRGTCDVADPSSPSATVAVVRVAGGRADHLLLEASVLVLDAVDAPVQVVEDRREPDIARPYQEQLTVLGADGVDADQIRNQAITAFRAQRNQPGGFWVAKDSANVVEHAATGCRPAAGLRTVTLLSGQPRKFVGGHALSR